LKSLLDSGEERHMAHAVKRLAVLLVVLVVAAGCRSMTGESLGQNIDDSGITAAVKAKLVADKVSNLTRVNVDTTNGTVYLNGSVGDTMTRSRAEQLAWQAKGVKAVVNNLQISQTK
jgi:hyperosmotically inducible periplasmic protein